MIYEGVITTRRGDGAGHVTPLGFTRDGAHVGLRPFVPSVTLANLRAHPFAAMNLTDDVRVVAGCLCGRRDWPLVPCERVDAPRLEDPVAHLELAVERVTEDDLRPTFHCAIVGEVQHRPWRGFNRAQAAVVEAAILVSRLDFLDPAKLEAELAYLHIAVAKTAGAGEREAWRWLVEAAADHPRHRIDREALDVPNAR
ncbi:MAG: DUF447 domain-containing protein [Gammaproteobacteria bacterium]